MSVTYHITAIPGDRNYHNQHAVVEDYKGVDEKLEFIALPFQPYLCRYGNTSAHVNKSVDDLWHISIWNCLSNGRSELLGNATFEIKDEAFEKAAIQLWRIERGSK